MKHNQYFSNISLKRSVTVQLLLLMFISFALNSCSKEPVNKVTKEFSVAGFDKVEAADDHTMEVKQDSVFSVSATGEAADIAELRVLVTNGALKIDYPVYRGNRKKVYIKVTAPVITMLDFGGASSGTAKDIVLPGTVKISLTGTASFSINAEAAKLDVNVSGNSSIVLSGSAPAIMADISGESKFNSYAISNTLNAYIFTSGQARASVFASNKLVADASGQSNIFYKGNPTEKILTQTGQAKILAQ